MEPEGQERGEGWEQGRGQGRDQGEEQEGKWDEKWGGEQGRGSVTTAVIQLSRSAPGLTQSVGSKHGRGGRVGFLQLGQCVVRGQGPLLKGGSGEEVGGRKESLCWDWGRVGSISSPHWPKPL